MDLSVLKSGDTVIHRNGGRSVVSFIEESKDNNWFNVRFTNESFHHGYVRSGRFFISCNCPFDIIAIEKPLPKQTPLQAFLDKGYACSYSESFVFKRIDELAHAINETLKEMEKKND